MYLKRIENNTDDDCIIITYTLDDQHERNIILRYKLSPLHTYLFETSGEFLEDLIKLLGFDVEFPKR